MKKQNEEQIESTYESDGKMGHESNANKEDQLENKSAEFFNITPASE